jgi:Helix-turn-helix domain
MPETLHWSPPITRLGARIWDLRHGGYNIIERMVAGKSWSEYSVDPRTNAGDADGLQACGTATSNAL